MPTFLHPLLGSIGAGQYELANPRTGTAVASHVECAFESAARRRGLLGRTRFGSGDALVLAPCRAVHTCHMNFPIDLIFAARDGTVVALRHSVQPWRAAWCAGAFATIELPAGTLAATGTREGDRLRLAPRRGIAGR